MQAYALGYEAPAASTIGATGELGKRTTLARIVRSIASGYLRRHLTAREAQIAEVTDWARVCPRHSEQCQT
ncbi:hypothetical protein HaLaN_05502 [Haematococcus lacustris]|uniref:Uncharacterized protein n=1 Tax=Haematococcus lacustris TaxID=44745 RepID=A0A699YJ27_HAELA|nr:hypothetical protein HaLaN_05502 [Haematococcus lacustris]